MADIFDVLLQAKEAYHQTKDIAGKVTGIGIAPVYEVFEDDTVTVLLPESGGRSTSPRLYRVIPGQRETYPAVEVGHTVAYGFIEGNANRGVYWGVLHNAINPPSDLKNYSYQLGKANIAVTPDSINHYIKDPESVTNTQSGISITQDKVTVTKAGLIGASLTVLDGAVVIVAGTMTYTFSQAGLNVSVGVGGVGGVFAMTGMASATINSKQISTIGAVDSRGDTLVTKGW